MDFDRLSDRERQCLQGVLRHLDPHQIGAEIGLSHHTVNNHLRNAREKLGATSSRQAAIRYGQHIAGQGENLAAEVLPFRPAASIEQSDDGEPFEHKRHVRAPLPVATRGRPWNDLSRGSRLLWPLLITIGLGLAAGALVSSASTLSEAALDLTR